MTGYELTYSLGNIRAANTDTLLKPFEIRGASKYGVMALHGATTQDEFAVADRWKSAKIAAHVAMAGIPVVAGRMSGDSFANDFAMTDMTNALPFLATSGCDTSKVHLIGFSMGMTLAIRWAAANLSKVASIQGVIPATSIDRIYQTNAGGLRASVGTAWGVTYPTALPAGAILTSAYSAIAGSGIPVRLHYTSSDTTILPADVATDAALLGVSGSNLVDLGGAFGHAERTIGLFDALGAGDSSDYINWIKGLGA